MKTKNVLMLIILSIIILSCNKEKDKDPIVVQPTPVINVDVYILDRIIIQNNIAYADTIRVMNNGSQTTSPIQNGKLSGARINGIYKPFGDYYDITNEELILGNPGSKIVTGFYSFKGDTLDYVFRTTNAAQPDFKALYLKVN